MKKEGGITLIALVITIIVLLILAGVSITVALDPNNGLFTRANKASEATRVGAIKEALNNAGVENTMESVLNGTVKTPEQIIADLTSQGLIKPEEVSSNVEGKPIITIGETVIDVEKELGFATSTIPDGLTIGSTVTYTPSGTYTEWTAEHSGYTSDQPLDSSTDDYKITTWKVYNIDKQTGKVELVPAAATTGKVYLKGADGYNNAVKLLNDACSSLYGNAEKGITARSINITDIENKLDYDPTTYTNTNVNVQYGQQYTSAYTSSKAYPNIYANEHSVIDGTENEGTLGLSEQKEFVTGSTSDKPSIQPYQTYYYLSNSDFSSKLETGYASLLLPAGSSTQYWVASRCVQLDLSGCYFDVRIVDSVSLHAYNTFNSDSNTGNYSRSLFPVVTLSSELIEGNATSGYSVK